LQMSKPEKYEMPGFSNVNRHIFKTANTAGVYPVPGVYCKPVWLPGQVAASDVATAER